MSRDLADLVRRGLAPSRRRSRRRSRSPSTIAIDDAGGRAPSAPAPACRRCTSRAPAPRRRGAAAAACRRRPGMMPSITSGWPTLASLVGDAEVARHARPRGRRRARCRESPRRAAWRRPRCRFSSACVPAGARHRLARASSAARTTLMSAPAMNVVPAPISTIASAAGSATRARTASSICRPDLGRQRVDRRVVDGQDGDAVLDFVTNESAIEISDCRFQIEF